MYATFFRTVLAPAALLGLGVSAAAQVAISEVIPDPWGSDPGNQTVELWNLTTAPVDLGAFRLCAGGAGLYGALPGGCVDLPAFPLAANGYVRVHWSAAGEHGPADLYTGEGFAPLPSAVGSVTLLGMGGIDVVDYVQWGGQAQGIVSAVRRGEWTWDAWVPAAAQGSSIAFDGLGQSFHDWFVDATPTLGWANTAPGDPHVKPYGFACAGTLGEPAIATDFGPPALGNQSFVITLANALPESIAVIAMSTGPASIHWNACLLHLDWSEAGFGVLAVQPVSPLGTVIQPLPVPHQTALVGQDLYLQAGVLDDGGPVGFALTRGLELEL
jgi:hypothetical protein